MKVVKLFFIFTMLLLLMSCSRRNNSIDSSYSTESASETSSVAPAHPSKLQNEELIIELSGAIALKLSIEDDFIVIRQFDSSNPQVSFSSVGRYFPDSGLCDFVTEDDSVSVTDIITESNEDYYAFSYRNMQNWFTDKPRYICLKIYQDNETIIFPDDADIQLRGSISLNGIQYHVYTWDSFNIPEGHFLVP